MAIKREYIISILAAVFMILPSALVAEELGYRWEMGLQGGTGYYIGEAERHIFNHADAVAGLQLRRKLNSHWALQGKAQWQRIRFRGLGDEPYLHRHEQQIENRQMLSIDVVAEYNFFRFGAKQYDDRIKPITPYIFAGIGLSIYDNISRAGAYLPLGFGMKWKFAKHWGLNVAWQHQIFFADNVEGIESMDNTFKLNGSNILNLDVTSSLTVGIVFEFAKQKGVCRICD